MTSRRQELTAGQRRFLDRLFAGDGDEAAVLRELGIPPRRYRRWLADPVFTEELTFRIGAARRQWQLLVARYAPAAAARLIALTTDEKPETARKACLDVLALEQQLDMGAADATEHQNTPRAGSGVAKREPANGGRELDPRMADRMLAFLAQEDAELDVPDESQGGMTRGKQCSGDDRSGGTVATGE